MKSISKETERTLFADSQVITLPNSDVAVMFETVETSVKSLFSDKQGLEYGFIPTKKGAEKKYVKWGSDNQMPYHVINRIESDEVLAQNKLFNMQVCFGQGIRVYDKATGKPTTNRKIMDFMDESNIQMFFAGVIQDMKYFCWSLAVVILDRLDNIVGIRRMPVENVRLGVADKNGNLTKAYFANWREDAGPIQEEDVEEIELLNMYAPWKDLEMRTGRERVPATGDFAPRSKNRIYGIICRFPIPGSRYYPIPPYAALFKDDWLEIKKLTQIRLKAGIKNTNSIRYHVEIIKTYWQDLFRRKHVLGNPEGEKKEMDAEYKRIETFLGDASNAGKAFISEYMTDPMGKENRSIRINTVDTGKQGGEFSDEITEACNMLCYADGIHPNLIGAVPGKTQTNNSGSDKRELFTMKQAMEDIWHQSIMPFFTTFLRYNKWSDEVGIDVPIVQLTTLDNHLDAIKAAKNNVPQQ